jgi:hypothetical protein
MKRRIIRYLGILVILSGVYFAVSRFLLNGRITYWTSFNPSTIQESKLEGVFVSDNNIVYVEGDSLTQWKSKFEIWTNKRYEVKYWGILFHWTFRDPAWRYLNIDAKNRQVDKKWSRSKLKINQSSRDYLDNFTGGWENCCNRIGCNRGDTITIQFVRTFEKDVDLGTLSVIVN